jgi:hypothetical protein
MFWKQHLQDGYRQVVDVERRNGRRGKARAREENQVNDQLYWGDLLGGDSTANAGKGVGEAMSGADNKPY